jgi:predicted nucleic acid-binding Zn ribbon protein
MRLIVLLLSIALNILNACTSDCTSCHPSLDVVNDERHVPLSTCSSCHPPESLENVDMEVGCGTDCFDCHSVKKLTGMEQHKPIENCIKCHTSMQKVDFTSEIKNLNFINDNSLKNILNK